MIRYVSVFNEQGHKDIKEMHDYALIVRKDIPDVPHYVLNIQIVRFDPTYEGITRPRLSLFKRVIRGLKEAWGIFMEIYCA